MKTKLTLIAILSGLNLFGQTITYSNFSNAITSTLSVNVADNSSFNSSLKTTIGNGVTWDASGLTVESGIPMINFSYSVSSSTPNGGLYPNSNYCFFDPSLTAFIAYEYENYNSDSIVEWGSYEPDASHEIFQDPDKHLIFPFSYGQSFVDSYAKTNYSDATTVSSNQTGTRTVTYNGFGTLILPQGTFTNVALISELRTNSLGSDSYLFTWYDISNGKKLLRRSENGSSISTAWCIDMPTNIEKRNIAENITLYPNPFSSSAVLNVISDIENIHLNMNIFNVLGKEILNLPITDGKTVISRNGLPSGLYFFTISKGSQEILKSGKIIIE